MGMWQGPRTPASARRWGRMVLSWRAPSFSGGIGLACAVVPPAHPPTFLETGGLPLYPRRGCAPAPCLGSGVLFWRALSISEGSGLACAVVPPDHPPTFLGTGGIPYTPGGGCAPGALVGGGMGLCLIVCVTAFSSPPALRRRGAVTKALQAITKPLRVVTQPLWSRYQLLPVVTSRYGVGWLQRACTLQRHSLRSHASSEGLAPWGVPSALLPQGDSLWLAPSAHVCGRLRGGEAGRLPTSWGTIAHPFVFCNGGGGRGSGLRRPPADGDGWFCLGLRPPTAKGLAWRAPLSRPHRPPTFLETGGPPLYPRRGLCPLHPAGGRAAAFAYLPPGAGVGTRCASWTEGLVVASALLERRVWLGLRAIPPAPPSDVFGNRGTRCTPGGGCAPCTLLGDQGCCCGLCPSSWDGLAWPAPFVPPGPPSNVFGNRGTPPVPPGGGCAPCTLLGDGGEA